DYGHAIYIRSDTGQSAAVDNVKVAENQFHDFNGQSWIAISATNGSPGIGLNGPITVSANVFDSDAQLRGGCAASRGVDCPVAMGWLHGSDDSDRGLVANVTVESNTFNAGYVKGAVAVWSGTKTIGVRNNAIVDTGLRLPPAPGKELGRYGILVYNSAHEHAGLHPDTVQLLNNTITNPVSCGIYGAVGRNLEIRGNRVSGQSDRFDGTLPKGAISLNHAESASVDANELSDNYIGIASVGSHIAMGTNTINPPAGGVRERIVQPR